MCAAGGNKILVSALHYTLINLLLLSHPQSCWETRPDSAMPGQAVSPSGCWHRSNRPDKKDPAETTRHWQAFNTAEQTDTHPHPHPPPSFHSLHSVPRSLTHSTHRQAGQLPTIISPRCCQARLFSWASLSLLHPKCTPPLSFQLIKWFTIPVFLCITEMVSSHPISWRRLGECSCVYSNKRSMWR